jgi:hypothetical protein
MALVACDDGGEQQMQDERCRERQSTPVRDRGSAAF